MYWQWIMRCIALSILCSLNLLSYAAILKTCHPDTIDEAPQLDSSWVKPTDRHLSESAFDFNTGQLASPKSAKMIDSSPVKLSKQVLVALKALGAYKKGRLRKGHASRKKNLMHNSALTILQDAIERTEQLKGRSYCTISDQFDELLANMTDSVLSIVCDDSRTNSPIKFSLRSILDLESDATQKVHSSCPDQRSRTGERRRLKAARLSIKKETLYNAMPFVYLAYAAETAAQNHNENVSKELSSATEAFAQNIALNNETALDVIVFLHTHLVQTDMTYLVLYGATETYLRNALWASGEFAFDIEAVRKALSLLEVDVATKEHLTSSLDLMLSRNNAPDGLTLERYLNGDPENIAQHFRPCARPELNLNDLNLSSLAFFQRCVPVVNRLMRECGGTEMRVNVSGNNLSNQDIETLTSLQNVLWLDISRCNLEKIPPSIAFMQTLGCLIANDNQLTEIASELRHLPNLYHLELKNNHITEFFKGHRALSSFDFKGMQQMDLQGNPLHDSSSETLQAFKTRKNTLVIHDHRLLPTPVLEEDTCLLRPHNFAEPRRRGISRTPTHKKKLFQSADKDAFESNQENRTPPPTAVEYVNNPFSQPRAHKGPLQPVPARLILTQPSQQGAQITRVCVAKRQSSGATLPGQSAQSSFAPVRPEQVR